MQGILCFKICSSYSLFFVLNFLYILCLKWMIIDVQVLHGAERGETAAMLLSPLRPTFKSRSGVDIQNGSQFTFFLTAPLQAFSQLVGLSFPNSDTVSSSQNFSNVVFLSSSFS